MELTSITYQDQKFQINKKRKDACKKSSRRNTIIFSKVNYLPLLVKMGRLPVFTKNTYKKGDNNNLLK